MLAALIILFGNIAQAKTFEILTPKVHRGNIAVIKIYPQFQTQAEGRPICIAVKWDGPDKPGQEYQPNNQGEIFIGIETDKKPDKYVVIRIECGRGIQLDFGYEELEIVEKNFPIRKRGHFKPTKKWADEREIIKNAFADGNYFEKYFKDEFIKPLDRIPLDQSRAIGDISLLGKFGAGHGGVDLITLNPKTKNYKRPVRAINSGRIALIAKNFSTEGNMVIIDHGSGIFSVYMHLFNFNAVKVGEQIKKGDVIGISGQSGRVGGPHLHFAVKVSNSYVDPFGFIETANRYLN